jgi:tetratricopeptide (TPR) repeat protein
MRRLAITLILISAFCFPSQSDAANREAKERSAKKACLAGDVAKGVAILAELYVDSDDANYMFNQGRCFEQNRRYEDAIARFREYLAKATNAPAADKAEAEGHIAACERYLGKPGGGPQAAQPTVAAQPSPDPIPPAGAAPASPADAGLARAAVMPRPESHGSGLRITGVVTAVVGAGALITGVALNLKVNRMTEDLEKPYGYNASTDSTRKDYKTLGWISYGVGAACMAAGAALYYLGWQTDRASSPALAIAPWAGPRTAGALLTGGF